MATNKSNRKKPPINDEKPAAFVPPRLDYATSFLARWANFVAILNVLDREATAVWKLGKEAESHGISPLLQIDVPQLNGLRLRVEAISSDSLVPPFAGSMTYIGQEQRQDAYLAAARKGGAA